MTRLLPALAVASLAACAAQQKMADPVTPTAPATTVEVKAPPPPTEEGVPAPVADSRFSGTVLHFGFNDSTLEPDSMKELQRVAEQLRKDQTLQIEIAGHADERGTTEYNLALGHRRADSARRYLVALGVPESRISIISYGEERPARAGEDEEAWAANRRDEISPK